MTYEVKGKRKKHGLCKSREYVIWKMMRQRCNNPNANEYHIYGGAGVKICREWDDFLVFLKDVGKSPSIYHSLDRYPDNTGNYEPGNVRWATSKEQQRNRKNNKILEFNGESKTVVEWSELIGLSKFTIYSRIEDGWSVEDALTTPIRQAERIFSFRGRRLTVKQWADNLGVSIRTLNTRIYKGWPLSKVFTKTKF